MHMHNIHSKHTQTHQFILEVQSQAWLLDDVETPKRLPVWPPCQAHNPVPQPGMHKPADLPKAAQLEAESPNVLEV
jgi:hypothetical protein